MTGIRQRLGHVESRMVAIDYETRLLEADRNISIAVETERQALAEIAATREGEAEARQEALRTALGELAEAEDRIAMAEGDVSKAGRRAGTMRLTAPVAGTVQQSKLRTIGGVVQPAEGLIVIVPEGAAQGAGGGLVAEVMILNRDIGFVSEGQEVAVKLEAFPFTDHGLIPGILTQISRDALDEKDTGLVYAARVTLDCVDTGDDTRRDRQTAVLCHALGAGMSATAEIKTDERRIIDYFLSPISKATKEAGRER
ncbi:HlyD family efflux transporter periplasmic adaptor subunit [Pacificimonas sp. ICDLI1SI03]